MTKRNLWRQRMLWREPGSQEASEAFRVPAWPWGWGRQVRYCTALHCTALHYNALHCSISSCTACYCSTADYCTVGMYLQCGQLRPVAQLLARGRLPEKKTARHARWKNIYTVKDFKPKYYPKGRITPLPLEQKNINRAIKDKVQCFKNIIALLFL